jgi:hypothetical protein
MPTVQTGIGTTVLGVAGPRDLLLGQSKSGDLVACVGTPKDGAKISYDEGDADVASIRAVEAVVASRLVHELLPVGSHGVAFEAGELAATAGLSLSLDPGGAVDLRGSAGASTCFLVAMHEDALEPLRRLLPLPVEIVGSLS